MHLHPHPHPHLHPHLHLHLDCSPSATLPGCLAASQMATDAQQHTAQRQGRFEKEDVVRHKQNADDEVEATRQMKRAAAANEEDERPAFLNKVAKETFDDTNINSVADRINQQKHYVQRGTSASAEGFLRPE